MLLLDFDGTVVDTMDEYSRIASQIISKYTGMDVGEARKVYDETRGMAFRDQLSVAGVPRDLVEEAAREFEEEKKGVLESVRIDDRVKEFVSIARRRGLKVILSTNNECSIVSNIRELREIFDEVLCHDPTTGIRKGADHVRIIAEKYAIPVENILFIGDSDYDLRLYSQLGVRSVKTRGIWADYDHLIEYLDGIRVCGVVEGE